MRLVREISEQNMRDSRWYYTALACIQEAVEDYLIEYFNDTLYPSSKCTQGYHYGQGYE